MAYVYTTFRDDNPQLVVDVDRAKAASLNVPLSNVFNTMQIYLGSLYVNDFDYLNQSYRVYVQAETPYRSTLEDLQKIYVGSSTGAIMPLTTLIHSTLDEEPAGHHALQPVPLDRAQRIAAPGVTVPAMRSKR